MKITIKCRAKEIAKLAAQTLAWQTSNEINVNELSEKLICEIKDCLDECSRNLTMNRKGPTMEHITVDTSAVPEPNADRLACAAIAAVRRSLAQPGGAERLERYAEQYYKRKAKRDERNAAKA